MHDALEGTDMTGEILVILGVLGFILGWFFLQGDDPFGWDPDA